ncbi:MAG TPA: sensor histidine kinase [Vicinamibacterales bacterium]|jgi:signal transduction histidine kinase
MIGAVLWTLGLLGTWALALTFHRAAFQWIAVVHGSPHLLMLGTILVTVAGYVIVRRGLSPLDTMRRSLGAVRTGAAERVEGRFPAEVQPLVVELNALLLHQQQAVRRAHAKAGDLAHGLKTPLAILTHEAERAAANGQTDLAAGISEQVERMRRQIEYHLAHARAAASGATAGARAPIAESAQALARTMLRLHAERGVAIEISVDPAHHVRCDRADLDEMLGNLLDNACKWGRGQVTVTSVFIPPEGDSRADAPQNGAIAIVVEDDGPGIEPALRDAVLQRGVRADEAAPGSGLGLAIVRELAELYDGRVSLDAAPAGGLSAKLTLPAAPAR